MKFGRLTQWNLKIHHYRRLKYQSSLFDGTQFCLAGEFEKAIAGGKTVAYAFTNGPITLDSNFKLRVAHDNTIENAFAYHKVVQ